MFWPIGYGEQFKGVLDCITNIVHSYTKAMQRRQKGIVEKVILENKDRLKELINDDVLYEKLFEDTDLLKRLINPGIRIR